ncbi:hypothetical protein Pyn_09048 [Prunus yedoensis var. nudiflora]|uniref:Uncharacterized protein n=1 Tax=Prunus yedoensis var. nudiflora TaxID=2094558 RepID=A0A314XWX9_PRUYE|nr:hypothetical protein Pyn_09048 [Prunus yedoensis var. nudiflora]
MQRGLWLKWDWASYFPPFPSHYVSSSPFVSYSASRHRFQTSLRAITSRLSLLPLFSQPLSVAVITQQIGDPIRSQHPPLRLA